MAKVLLKKSSVGDNAPGTGDLEYGELAINYADGRLYYKNSSNQIKNFVDSDILLASYLRSVWDDKTPEIGGNLEINSYRITNDTYGTGSYLGLQEYYTGDSDQFQQAVFASRQDVNILVNTNGGGVGGSFLVRAGDSDVSNSITIFSVEETNGLITAYGNINFDSASKITNLASPTDSADAANKTYVDVQDSFKVNKSGDTMSGNLNMGSFRISDLSSPAVGSDAANKTYVDDAIAAGVGSIDFPFGDYGLVDSEAHVDAFGIPYTNSNWDMLTNPTNSLPVVDLNS